VILIIDYSLSLTKLINFNINSIFDIFTITIIIMLLREAEFNLNLSMTVLLILSQLPKSIYILYFQIKLFSNYAIICSFS